jgi:hypothetical protein
VIDWLQLWIPNKNGTVQFFAIFRPHEIEKTKHKNMVVKRRLENLLYDVTNKRFFGPKEDPYIWLYEDELPGGN